MTEQNAEQKAWWDISRFHYHLPEELIARYPASERRSSRLLMLNGASGRVVDRRFTDLPGLVSSKDLLVLNDTRVIRARLYGRKSSGGRCELLIERILDSTRAAAQIKASRAPKPGHRLSIGEGSQRVTAMVERREEDFFILSFSLPVAEVLRSEGQVALPPYLRRGSESVDEQRYQTVYARRSGAVAAPTAGLHFDRALIAQLRASGVDTARLTLHVGAGTFQPVRKTDVRCHRMHPEWLEVPPSVCAQVAKTRSSGGRVIAVGTTVVRALETAASSGRLKPYTGETRLFIYPGYRFRVVDALLTNFHLPGSSLLMLVCAFAGTDHTLSAYTHAIEHRYRFYSYGDAMLVSPQPGARAELP